MLQLLNLLLIAVTGFAILFSSRLWAIPVARFYQKLKIPLWLLFPLLIVVLCIFGFYFSKFSYTFLHGLSDDVQEKAISIAHRYPYDAREANIQSDPYYTYSSMIDQWALGLPIIVCFNLFFLWLLPLNVIQDTKADKKKKADLKKAYGVQGWATLEQIEQATSEHGLHIGSQFYWKGQGHILTTGGTRGGKGVHLVLPALLNDDLQEEEFATSFILLDPKGENCAVSGAYLKKCGYNVQVINPFGIPEIAEFGNARFNPFDLVTPENPDVIGFSDMIANSLLPSSRSSSEHFEESARQYLSFYILHMITQNDEPKSFKTLYNWIRLGGTDRVSLLDRMAENPAFDGIIQTNADSVRKQIFAEADKEIESIYSTCRRGTDVFKDLQLRNSTSASDFDLKTIAKEKTALFICVNPKDLDRVQGWLRILFNCVLNTLTVHYNKKRKTVVLLDEFPTIGYLKEFETASGFLAGYNVTLWPIIQDLTQLRTLYPNSWETFINNAIVKHWLSVGDNFTADYLGKRMPKDLIFIQQPNGDREVQKNLLDPNEVLTFNGIITEIKGMAAPAWFKRVPYTETNDNGAPNPFRD
jgi:type IV secretion system protein VirD4